MTISRRMGLGYALISAVCLALVVWLGYHEFVEEPAEFAAMGLPGIHKDTDAEFSTVCFLAVIPLLLAIGWWWMRHLLAPLKELSEAVAKIDSNNLRQPLPRSMNGDEVDKLSEVVNSMTLRLNDSFHHIQEFTLHASHELKTPLTVMRAQLETVLRDRGSSPPSQNEWIESQIDEVRRLTHIVDSLTLLTKADAGLVQLERESVPLDCLVEEAFEDALILAQPHDVKVTLVTCEAVRVIGDRQRLRQLLLILTDNAVKYNHPGGMIRLALHHREGAAEFRITNSDTGPKSPGNVFGRFVRGENALAKADGCGLGLTIAQWIVHAHGGNIQLIPESNEQVSVVVRIPIDEATAGAPETNAMPTPASLSTPAIST